MNNKGHNDATYKKKKSIPCTEQIFALVLNLKNELQNIKLTLSFFLTKTKYSDLDCYSSV